MSPLHSHSGPKGVSIKLTACRYCAHSNEDYIEYLLSEDKAIYMNFLDWMPRTSRKKKLQTYNEYWQCLCQYFGLFACQPVNHHVHEQMQQVCLSFLFHSYTWILNRWQYLEQVFPAEHKISRHAKKKSTLDIDNFCILLHHHWVHSSFFHYGSRLSSKLWSCFGPPSQGLDQACYFHSEMLQMIPMHCKMVAFTQPKKAQAGWFV